MELGCEARTRGSTLSALRALRPTSDLEKKRLFFSLQGDIPLDNDFLYSHNALRRDKLEGGEIRF